MSRGDEVGVNPEAYLIQKDSLYLFYRTRFTNMVTKWEKIQKFFRKSRYQLESVNYFFNPNLAYYFEQMMEQF